MLSCAPRVSFAGVGVWVVCEGGGFPLWVIWPIRLALFIPDVCVKQALGIINSLGRLLRLFAPLFF